MLELVSDIPVRKEKISQLKIKVNSEIENLKSRLRRQMRNTPESDKDVHDTWNDCAYQYYCLYMLEEYVNQNGTFMNIEHQMGEYVTYSVSDKYLNIWLQDDYNFACNFLANCFVYDESDNCKVVDILSMMNDRYFGLYFTNIFEEIQYDDRLKKKKETYLEEVERA